jgi:hypothetical protein
LFSDEHGKEHIEVSIQETIESEELHTPARHIFETSKSCAWAVDVKYKESRKKESF